MLPLGINSSYDCYTVEDGAIMVGPSQLKGMSAAALRSILEAREKGETFRGIEDFLFGPGRPGRWWRTSSGRVPLTPWRPTGGKPLIVTACP